MTTSTTCQETAAPTTSASLLIAVIGDELQEPIRRLVNHLLGSRGRELVEDTTQDILLKLIQQFHRFDPSRIESLRPWAMTVARNHCLDCLRRRQLPTFSLDEGRERTGSEPVCPEPDPLQAALREDERTVLLRELERLPEGFREPLRLRHLLGLSYRNIAQLTGLPVGTLKTQVWRGRERLRARMCG